MNIGEVIVKFGAEISGFMAGIAGVQAGFGLFKDAIGEAMYGLSTLGTGAPMGGMTSLKFAAQDLGKSFLILGGLAIVAGAAIVTAIAIKATGAAADFQQGLNRLVTGAGDVTDNMKQLGQGMLGVSVATGVLTSGTAGLNAAMYLIISSGQRGAQALDTLRAAAQGAQIEQANMVDVTQILTTLQTDFGLHTYTATQYMNGLVAAVKNGKISLENLSTAMSPILPNAKELGIHFADVAAAMADMTNQGIPADQAAQALRFTMQSMILPTKASQTAMREWGLDTNKVAAEMKISLPGAIQMYIDAAKRAGPEGSKPFIDALSNMMGGGQRAAKALFSLSQSMGVWRSDIAAVNVGLGLNSRAVAGWDIAQSGLNIKVSQAKAAFDALLITVGTALLPVLTKIIAQVTPLVISFTNWAVQSGALQTTVQILGAVLSGLITGIVTLVTWGVRVVQFFQQSQVASSLLLAALIVLAVVIGTVLVIALYSYAAAAYVAAAANIIAFWPVYLIILIIIVVIALVILAVRNWGAIAHWLQGVWAAVIGWLGGAWHSLVGIASSVGNAIAGAFNAVIAWIVGAWHSAIAFIVGIWNTLVGFATSIFNAVKTTIMAIINGVITWLTNAWHNAVATVVGWFNWLYNHNYYFKALVDTIRSVVQAVITWLQTAWQNVVTFVVGLWNTLSGAATTAYNAVKNAISTAVNAAIAWLTNVWNMEVIGIGVIWNKLKGLATSAWQAVAGVFNAAIGWISAQLNALWAMVSGWFSETSQGMQTKTTGAWQGVSTVFSSAWGSYVAGPLNSLGSAIGGFFSGLATQMYQFGVNLIQGLIDGINSMIGAIGNAANNIASTITGILGFHSPPAYGPAADADTWMPNMIAMLTQGMIAGVPSVTKAAGQVAQPIQGNLSAGGTARGGNSSADTRALIIQFHQREIVRALMPAVQQELLVHFGGR